MEGFDWEAELRDGEELIWTGEPGRTLRLTLDDVPLVLIGLVALMVAVTALFTGRWGVMAVSLPFGLYFAGGQQLLAAAALRSSQYALTSQRALWVSGWPKQHLRSTELRLVSHSELVMARSEPGLGTITFQHLAGPVGRLEPFRAAPPAFRLIPAPAPLLPIIRGEVGLPLSERDRQTLARRQERGAKR